MTEPVDHLHGETMTEPVDHLDGETERVRQGTGPRATVSVLLGSLMAAAIVGAVVVGYYVGSN
jgi:hypothetical protein